MLDEVISIITAFEADQLTESTALSRIKDLTGKDVDSYSLNNYWSSEDREDFARRLATPPIDDWQAIDDARALELINQIMTDVCDDAVIERNMEALAKRYGKPSFIDLVFRDDLTPEQILEELKKDTRIYL